jgi:hypothetical protein
VISTLSPAALAAWLEKFESYPHVVRARGREVVSLHGAEQYEITLTLTDGHVARVIDADPERSIAAAERLLRWRHRAKARG